MYVLLFLYTPCVKKHLTKLTDLTFGLGCELKKEVNRVDGP